MEELIQHFSFDHVHKAGARFDPEKAKWFNEQYLRKQTAEALANRLQPVVKSMFNLGDDDVKISSDYLVKAVSLLKDRVQFESELIEKGSYLFQAPDVYDEQVLAKKWKPELASFFIALIENLSSLQEFNSVAVDATIKSTATTSGIKPGEIMQLLRVFVSGQGAGVDLIGMLELFGKNEVIERLNKALKKVN